MSDSDVYCWQWFRASAAGLHWRSFGASAVVFNEKNGDTHLVDAIVPLLLDSLSIDLPRSLLDICDDVDCIFGEHIDERDRQALVLSSLQQLEEMNLVRVLSN